MRKKNNDTFILEAVEIYKDLYDYSEVNYINSRTKVGIVCKKHGIFYQNPRSHLKGHGCPKCGSEARAKKQKLNFYEFESRAIKIHGNKYDYSCVRFSNIKSKIRIKCEIHGMFQQSVASHLNGAGCPNCSYRNSQFNYSSWENSAKESKKFDDFKLYIIKCWNDDEEFYKIGKTYTSITERFRMKKCKHMPYNYKVLHEIVGSSRAISELEYELHKFNEKYNYCPKIKFSGYSECFSEYKLIIF